MKSSIQTFLISNYDSQAFETLQLLAQSGSSRKYYRFFVEDKSWILTESENVEENRTFLYFTEHFAKVIDNLPKIDKVSDDLKMYSQSDLGNISLMNVLESDRGKAKEIYKKAISQMVKMQVLGDANLDYSKCFSYPKFNSTLVLRDLFSFKNYFLNLSQIEFNQGKLLADFERFALDFEQIPHRYFVFRDFQSRNIMVKKDEPYFIDYQGGVKGPVQYDLVSLLWQAKANLSKEWKSEFYELFVQEFIKTSKQDLDGFAFKKGYDLCLVERLLQVLGTYGFRGIYERKPHFLNSIELALQNLSEIQDLGILDNYTELQKVIRKLAEPETYLTLQKRIHER